MRNRRPKQPSVVSRQVVGLRRQVWRRRLIVILVIVVCTGSWQLYLNNRFAHLRDPDAALAADAQVLDDALTYLADARAQLTLEATVTNFARVGPPDELAPSATSLQIQGRRLTVRLSGYGSVSETGAPLISLDQLAIASHTLDRAGRVHQIIMTCSYSYCWDREATSGAVLPPEQDLPQWDSSGAAAGQTIRHSHGLTVEDRLADRFSYLRP